MWLLKTDDRATEAFTFRILPGNIKTIGRSTGAEFMVDAAMISRLHCRLTAGAAVLARAPQRRRDSVLEAAEQLILAAQRFPGTVIFVTNEVGGGIVVGDGVVVVGDIGGTVCPPHAVKNERNNAKTKLAKIFRLICPPPQITPD